MNVYFALKWLHIVSGTIIFGTGIGIAYFKWITDCSADVRAIRIVSERTVLADWIFTAPAVLVQPASGIALMRVAGYPITAPWITWSLVLYAVAGACWIPVVLIQIRMRELARAADEAGAPQPLQYWRHARAWICLGTPAFGALIAVYWLMIAKPMT